VLLSSTELGSLVEELRAKLGADPGSILDGLSEIRAADLADALNMLTVSEAERVLSLLPIERAASILTRPNLYRRPLILEQFESSLAAQLLNEVPADERTDMLQRMSARDCRKILPQLNPEARKEAEQLLKYPPHSAGGIMTTEFVRLDPKMNVAEALAHVRSVARERELIYACYILEPETSRLLGAVSLRDLVVADPLQSVSAIMRKNPISVETTDDREDVARKISRYNLLAAPVLEEGGKVVGFVTVDDIIDVLVEEQTEDILRLGGIDADLAEGPYIGTSFLTAVRRRARWLVLLFVGEMLTATAMGFFEDEIAKAVVLALFVPLIISSGGNSGSQAATLIIRAMALREIELKDWWHVMKREIGSGLALGSILGIIGFLRIAIWSAFTPLYGPHWFLVGMTVSTSLVGVVLWGTISGSMLPFILKRFGADPAVSSAPFVATIVDVTGLIIYFTVAMFIMRGVLL